MVVRGLKKVMYPACKMTYGIHDSLGFSSKLSEASDLSGFHCKISGCPKIFNHLLPGFFAAEIGLVNCSTPPRGRFAQNLKDPR